MKGKVQPLHVLPAPCNTCPYRRDTPPGLWHPDEYAKLPAYDDGQLEPALGVFLCHQTNATGCETVCRGWLTVAGDSIAARLALCHGQITVEQRDAPVSVPLYESGQEAAEAGMSGVEKPSPEAKRQINRLLRKGAGRADDK